MYYSTIPSQKAKSFGFPLRNWYTSGQPRSVRHGAPISGDKRCSMSEKLRNFFTVTSLSSTNCHSSRFTYLLLHALSFESQDYVSSYICKIDCASARCVAALGLRFSRSRTDSHAHQNAAPRASSRGEDTHQYPASSDSHRSTRTSHSNTDATTLQSRPLQRPASG